MRFLPLLALAALALPAAAAAVSPSIAEYPSIQAAIDANPGEMIFVPSGDHVLASTVTINTPGTGLWGPGRLVQPDPDAIIIRVENTSDVTIRDIAVLRPEGAQVSSTYGILFEDASNVTLDGVRVLDCKTNSGGIQAVRCNGVTIRDCTILNYKRLWIDDRMEGDLLGYSFQCVDGSGIIMRYSNNVLIEGNRVSEHEFVPSRENRDKHELGKITEIRKDPPPGRLAPKPMLDSGYTNNWHQGSAIVVTGLGTAQRIIIRGNVIENAAQGIDLHVDNVIVANNIVDGAMIGMKAMHGSRNVLIEGNQFLRFDLWGVMLGPGAASHLAEDAAADKPARDQNTDGGHIIANNIFAKIGEGGQRWNWEDQRDNDGSMMSAIAILGGQIEENPPLRRVVIEGNMVNDTNAEGVLVDGKVATPPPGHKYALYIDANGNPPPEQVTVRGNHFDAGFRGVSNVPIDE